MYDPSIDYMRGFDVFDPTSVRSWDPAHPTGGGAFGDAGDGGTAATFIADIQNYLGEGSPAYYDWNSVGAALIVDSMLGEPGGSLCSGTGGHCTWSDGVSYALANFSTWKARVEAYDANGLIDWSASTFLKAGTTDSTHTCLRGYTSAPYCSVPGRSDLRFDQRDIAWRANKIAVTANLIVFHNPDGSVFRLRRDCGNVVGPLAPLVSIPIKYSLTPTVTASSSDVDPGGRATFRYSVDNSGPSSSPSDTACQAVATTYGPPPHTPAGVISGGKRAGGGATDVPDVSCSGALKAGTTSLGSVTITIPSGAPPGSTYCRSLEVAPMDDSHTDITKAADWRTSAEACVIVSLQPYVSVEEGDVNVGDAMSISGGDCAVTQDDNAGIASWNTRAGGSYTGAGTQYAAFALGFIQDFATAQGSSLQPTGLSFANNSDGKISLGAGLFGGNFATGDCVVDQFMHATDVHASGAGFTIPGVVGDQTVPSVISGGTHMVVYVTGNVYINNNITFAGSSSGGKYASVTDIPSFYLVVSGNIYIAPTVTELDGVYIAQATTSSASPGGATNGIIYTCASSPFTSQPLDSTLYDDCSSSALTVDGSLIARQVWFERAAGTLSKGTPAETIDQSPDIWAATPPDELTSIGTASNNYDAITSLPPIL